MGFCGLWAYSIQGWKVGTKQFCKQVKEGSIAQYYRSACPPASSQPIQVSSGTLCVSVQMIQGVGNASIRDMDLWSISLTSGLPDQHQKNALQNPHPPQKGEKEEGSKRRRDIPLRDQAPFIDDEMPAAMHAQHDNGMQGSKRAGKFTYYFTVGLDAEAAYRCNSPAVSLTSKPVMLQSCCCYLLTSHRMRGTTGNV